MSPQVHARIDEKHFKIVGPPFSNTVGEFRELLSAVWNAFIFEKLAKFFHLQTFFSN